MVNTVTIVVHGNYGNYMVTIVVHGNYGNCDNHSCTW